MPELDQRQRTRLATHLAGLVPELDRSEEGFRARRVRRVVRDQRRSGWERDAPLVFASEDVYAPEAFAIDAGDAVERLGLLCEMQWASLTESASPASLYAEHQNPGITVGGGCSVVPEVVFTGSLAVAMGGRLSAECDRLDSEMSDRLLLAIYGKQWPPGRKKNYIGAERWNA